MTLRELCKKYQISDSISERERLSEEIEIICQNYLNHRYELEKSVAGGKDVGMFSGMDFRSTSGSLTLDHVTDSKVVLDYEDYWSYGGACKERYLISFDDYENFSDAIFIKTANDRKMQILKQEIRILRTQIEEKEKQLEELSDATN